jgi:hypothetical protein
MSTLLISTAAFLGVAALVAAIAYVIRDFGSSTAEDRLAVMTGQTISRR